MKNIKLFWEWITYNERTLRNLTNEKPEIQKLFLFWLDKHLHYYSEGLDSIFIFPERKKQSAQLIITANGNADFFPQVVRLIDNAPRLQNWEFIAFVQPLEDIEDMEAGMDKPYVFKDINLKASELKFMPFQYEGIKKIDMIVYLKNFKVYCNNKNLLQVIYIIVQDIIGEKSLAENINFVELAQMPEHENVELIYLYDLQYYLDEINILRKSN